MFQTVNQILENYSNPDLMMISRPILTTLLSKQDSTKSSKIWNGRWEGNDFRHGTQVIVWPAAKTREILFVKYVMRPGSWPALHTQLVCCNNQRKNVVPNLGFSLLCSALPFTKSIMVVEIQSLWFDEGLFSLLDYPRRALGLYPSVDHVIF